jgi:hypothetical protein
MRIDHGFWLLLFLLSVFLLSFVLVSDDGSVLAVVPSVVILINITANLGWYPMQNHIVLTAAASLVQI